MNNKVSIDKWASDLDIDIIKNGEIFDVNVINRSIELILEQHTEKDYLIHLGSTFS